MAGYPRGWVMGAAAGTAAGEFADDLRRGPLRRLRRLRRPRPVP